MSAIIYLLQVSACMGGFYIFYYFGLSRLTFFTINRYYLLVTLLLSFVIPALTIHVHQDYGYVPVIQHAQTVYMVNTLPNLSAQIKETVVEKGIDWVQVLKLIYSLVAVALFVHLLITLVTFFTKIKDRKIDRVGNVNILRGDKTLSNGSFLNYIFLNDDELSPDELKQIVAHEMLHVKLLHSVDRIIAKIIQIILWFNPVVYLYARSIEENHEFEVDREIARSTDKTNYADLLLHLSVARNGSLYHSFSKVPLKKRITMLFNKPSAKIKRVIYISVIPLLVIACAAFAKFKNDSKQPGNKQLYSVIDEVGNLGEKPVVLIDGKVYPKDILYKIGSDCILRADILTGKNDPPDGMVKITTKTGKITYMTAYEKESLIKIAAIPKSQLYTRITLKRPDGKSYDWVTIQSKGRSSASDDIPVNGKVGFLIKNKLYSENDFKNLSPKIKDSLFNTTNLGASGAGIGFGILHKMGYQNDFSGYDVILQFLDKAQIEKEREINKTLFEKERKVFEQERKKVKVAPPQNVSKPYSVIAGLEKLGKDPLVLIDDHEYPVDILYKIGKSCIGGTGVFAPPVRDVKKYGAKAKDGVVDIRTKNGEITYLTAIEKYNLATEAAIPKNRFYNRLQLKNEDGSVYDKIVMRPPLGGEIVTSIGHIDKAAILIDQKVYDEKTILKVPAATLKAITGEYSVEGNKHWPKLQAYTAIFTFKTKKADSNNMQFLKTDAYKQRSEAIKDVGGIVVNFKVKEISWDPKSGKPDRFILTYNNNEYVLNTRFGQDKLNAFFKEGASVALRVIYSNFTKQSNVIFITGADIYQNDKVVYQYAEAAPVPGSPFLTEINNKVHLADGQVSHIEKYPDGKYKSILLEDANGYVIKLNFKDNVTSVNTIKNAEHIRLRFAKEFKTGMKKYTVDDWVSITSFKDNKVIKNPDLFYQFYVDA